jgi:hydroxypyruvate reductase
LESAAWESPKPGDAMFENTSVHLIATPQQSLMAAAALAESKGLRAYVLSDEIEGESREVGKVHAALARASAHGKSPFVKPCVILSGGETTVTVRNNSGKAGSPQREGRGGRAGEFCMGLALGLQGQQGVWALAADTDGIDGMEDNAGALVTPNTLLRGLQAGVNLEEHLACNDAYGYFQALDDLVFSGPTHTNVNDFRAILVL